MSRQTVFSIATAVLGGAVCLLTAAPRERRVVRATVVAYEQSTALMNLTSAPQIHVFIVRTEKASSAAGSERFLRVVLQTFHGQTLPPGLFEGGHQWRMTGITSAASEACTAPLKNLKWLEDEAKSQTSDVNHIQCLQVKLPGVKRIPKITENNEGQ